jgi:hypothetical protein
VEQLRGQYAAEFLELGASDGRREHHWETHCWNTRGRESRHGESRLFARRVAAYGQAGVSAERTYRRQLGSVEQQIGHAVHYRGDSRDA